LFRNRYHWTKAFGTLIKSRMSFICCRINATNCMGCTSRRTEYLFNQQWVNYTGLSLEESYGNGWIKSFHPDDQKSIRCLAKCHCK
jgi:hypothetical protein